MNDRLARRKLILLGAVALTALFIGFFGLSPFWAEQVVVNLGYLFLLTAFILFTWSISRLIRRDRQRIHWRSLGFGCSLATILVAFVFLWSHEPVGFKILMDELILLGTSMTMHFERGPRVPAIAHNYFGDFEIPLGYLDKRPLFHPFVLTLLHDLTGYRPENAFVLNFLLTPLLLGLTWLLGRKLGGHWQSGVLAVAIFGFLPLLAQNATSGHFELLNLVMIATVALCAMRYLQQPEAISLNALVFSAILLAQTRYESALFALPVGIAIIVGWIRVGRIVLTWPVVIGPALLLCVPLQLRVFQSKPVFWQLDDKASETAFSLSYFGENLGHAGRFLFDFGQGQANSVILSALGLVGVLAFPVFLILHRRRIWQDDPAPLGFALMLAGGLAAFLLGMCYHWGQLDDPTASRFALPMLFLAALCGAAATSRWPRPVLFAALGVTLFAALLTIMPMDPIEFRGRGVLVVGGVLIAGALILVPLLRGLDGLRLSIGFALGFALVLAVPTTANHRYGEKYTPAEAIRMMRRFFAENRDRNIFFTADTALCPIVHRVPSTGIPIVRDHPETIKMHLDRRNYSGIYAFQLLKVDPDSGETTVVDKFDLGPAFELETVVEKRLVTLLLARIVEITDVHLDRASEPECATAPTAPTGRGVLPGLPAKPDLTKMLPDTIPVTP